MADIHTNENIVSTNIELDSSTYEYEYNQLPIANVTRIIKKILPPGSKISKDAKECIQECVTEFVCFIAGEASDRCYQEKRKTINGDDIIWALQNLGFDYYVEPLKAYLQKHRDQTATTKRSSSKTYESHSVTDQYIQNDLTQYSHGQNYLQQYYVTDQYRGLLDISGQQPSGLHKDESMDPHKNP